MTQNWLHKGSSSDDKFLLLIQPSTMSYYERILNLVQHKVVLSEHQSLHYPLCESAAVSCNPAIAFLYSCMHQFLNFIVFSITIQQFYLASSLQFPYHALSTYLK